MRDEHEEIRSTSSREHWPVHKYGLGEEPGDDLSDSTTAEQRLAMMWTLALEAWRLMGMPLPDYERAAAPVTIHRPKTGTGPVP